MDTAEPRAITLEQVWEIALAMDQRLRADASRIQAATSTLHAAEAERWPIATLRGQYTWRENEPAFRIDNPLLPFSFESPYLQTSEFGFEGRVSVPIYTGGTVSSEIGASSADLSARQFQANSYCQHLRLKIAEEYLAVLRADYAVVVARSHASSLAAHARDIQMLYHCERVPRNDLLAAQVALSNSEHEVIRSENAFDAARAALNRRLARPLESPITLSPPKMIVPEEDLDALTQQALTTRSELAQLDAMISSLHCHAEALAGKNRAQVSLQGAYTFRENEFQSPEGITSAGVGVTWRPFDAGRIQHQTDARRQQARALAHQRQDLESEIRLQVRKAWLSLQESRRRIQVMRDAVDRAEENFRVSRQRYQNGMSTNTDVLSAEALRVSAHHHHNDASLDATLMSFRLRHAIGAL